MAQILIWVFYGRISLSMPKGQQLHFYIIFRKPSNFRFSQFKTDLYIYVVHNLNEKQTNELDA